MQYLILGRGYTGRTLEKFITAQGHQVRCTSRTNPELIQFDLKDESSWKNLPKDNNGTFITLALNDLVLAEKFIAKMATQLGKVIFISTTSVFLVDEIDQLITEESALDENNPRKQAEDKLIEAGGIRVYSAGIYGPGRSPVNWVKRGRVGLNDGYVNLIHVEDLVQVLWKAMLLGKPAESYLASDGQPMRWSEIITLLELSPGKTNEQKRSTKKISKRINPSYSLETLDVQIKFPNVVEGVKFLQE
jgi:nucleoside-diphosphate-sugar epimerase